MLAASIFGFDITWAVPKGYEPDSEVVNRSEIIAEKTGSKLIETNDPVDAVKNADVIYTDVFVSMGEEHLDNKMNDFSGFQVNEELVSNAKEDFIFLHCLPAPVEKKLQIMLWILKIVWFMIKLKIECGHRCQF